MSGMFKVSDPMPHPISCCRMCTITQAGCHTGWQDPGPGESSQYCCNDVHVAFEREIGKPYVVKKVLVHITAPACGRRLPFGSTPPWSDLGQWR